MTTILKGKFFNLFILFLFSLFFTTKSYSIEGCMLHGVNSINNDRIRLIDFPGNDNFSKHFSNMSLAIVEILELANSDVPIVAIYDDSSSANALALSNSWISVEENIQFAVFEKKGQKIQNAILLGGNMMWDLAAQGDRKNDLNTGEVFAVLSHEFGHLLQYLVMQNPRSNKMMKVASDLSNSKTRDIELQADALAGWIFGIATIKGLGFDDNDLTAILNRVYSLGDFSFNSEQHHGTPNQRVNAFDYGFKLAKKHRIDNKNDAFYYSYEKYIENN
jgi:hypothetical protein